MRPTPTPPRTGLILSGGGARAAYQVGVLQAMMHIRRSQGGAAAQGNPFPVITGTSAGAINACALASRCDDFEAAVQALAWVWENFSADQVYRADAFGVVRTSARWLTMLSMGWAIARWRRNRPRSLLDNSPLDDLLARMIRFERLPTLLMNGHLHGVAVSASSYSSGEHVTFYDSMHPVEPWERSQRTAVASAITRAHLLASSAIPFVFPAVPIEFDEHRHWFGDGSMRQSAPISPAIHLGAERLVVIGAGRMQQPGQRNAVKGAGYPSLAMIAGHALSNIFLDALAVDVERLQRINRTLGLLSDAERARSALRPIDVLLISPSQRLDDIAVKHVDALPPAVRTLLRGVGVRGAQSGHGGAGGALASYLLFEAAYTRELMALGRSDTLARSEEVAKFFGWNQAAAAQAPSGTVEPTAAQSAVTAEAAQASA